MSPTLQLHVYTILQHQLLESNKIKRLLLDLIAYLVLLLLLIIIHYYFSTHNKPFNKKKKNAKQNKKMQIKKERNI